MRQFIYILLIITLSTVASAQTRIDVTLTVDSAQREFIISQPTGPAPAGGYPIVFMFHGTSQGGQLFWDESQWKEKGEAEKFISVFPTALRYCIIEDGIQRTTTKWHNGELDEIACPGQNLRNDLHFVQAMLDTIHALFPINDNKIFASGFSNGGGFASKLAVEMSDVFSAIAVSGGSLGGRDSAEPKRRIPFWFNLGTRDDKWLASFSGIGLTEFPFNDSTLAYLQNSLRRVLDVFGLDTAHTSTEINRALIYHFATPSGAGPTTEFNFSLIDNMFHVYPNGNNVPFAAANVFWEFFSRSTSSIPPAPSQQNHVTLYPNPTSDYITVDGEGELTLTLRTLLGEVACITTGRGGRRIDLPKLPSGTYIAEVSRMGKRSVEMVVVR